MSILETLWHNGQIIFFSQGDKCVKEFIGQKDRPSFFWFHDSFYSHFSIEKQDRYLHIFIKRRDDYSFSFMQGNKTWDDVYNYYLRNKQELNKIEDIRQLIAHNPPILRSSDTIIPDLIFDFEKEGNIEAVCIFPEKYRGVRCKFFNEKHFPIDFGKMPELNKAIFN